MDPKGKAWYLPPGHDPLLFRYWAYLENTFKDRAQPQKQAADLILS